MDDRYTSAGANQVNINQAFTQLGLAYVQYLKDGGAPLTDIVAKYTADGADADTLPDRLQSLHDAARIGRDSLAPVDVMLDGCGKGRAVQSPRRGVVAGGVINPFV